MSWLLVCVCACVCGWTREAAWRRAITTAWAWVPELLLGEVHQPLHTPSNAPDRPAEAPGRVQPRLSALTCDARLLCRRPFPHTAGMPTQRQGAQSRRPLNTSPRTGQRTHPGKTSRRQAPGALPAPAPPLPVSQGPLALGHLSPVILPGTQSLTGTAASNVVAVATVCGQGGVSPSSGRRGDWVPASHSLVRRERSRPEELCLPGQAGASEQGAGDEAALPRAPRGRSEGSHQLLGDCTCPARTPQQPPGTAPWEAPRPGRATLPFSAGSSPGARRQ